MKKTFLTLALGAMVAFTACNNNDNLVPEDDLSGADLTVTTKSVATTDANIEDVIEASDYEVSIYSGSILSSSALTASESTAELKSGGYDNPFRNRYKLGDCPNVSLDNNDGTYPKTIVLDYGDGIELNNGRVISGIIQIVISAPRTESGATHTVTFDGFMVDSIGIEGVSVTTFMLEEYQILIDRELTFTLPDGTTIDVDAERTKTWVEGMDTLLDGDDDVYEITGYSNCVDSDGNSFRKEITIPLEKTGTCRYIVAGDVALSQNGVVFAVIDYGDGTCDNVATYTTDEGTEEFTIGQRVREQNQNRNQNQNQNRNGQ